MITTDRGLAGPLNTNTVRFALKEILEHEGDVAVVTVGRKGRDALRRAHLPLEAHFAGFGDRPSFADVTPLTRLITDDFLAGHLRPDRPRLPEVRVDAGPAPQPGPAPPDPAGRRTPRASPATSSSSSRTRPPSSRQLLPRYVATRVYQAILETTASEMSSKMVAMKNATENAEELIEDLTLSYNKVRQANITREMIEIASGARAR